MWLGTQRNRKLGLMSAVLHEHSLCVVVWFKEPKKCNWRKDVRATGQGKAVPQQLKWVCALDQQLERVRFSLYGLNGHLWPHSRQTRIQVRYFCDLLSNSNLTSTGVKTLWQIMKILYLVECFIFSLCGCLFIHGLKLTTKHLVYKWSWLHIKTLLHSR